MSKPMTRDELRRFAENAMTQSAWTNARQAAAILDVLDGPPEGTRLVLMSDELMDKLAEPRAGYIVTWEWGDPDENGWYSPTFTEYVDPTHPSKEEPVVEP